MPQNSYYFYVQADGSGHPVALWATGLATSGQTTDLLVHHL
jgi:adenylylsulfate kinase-like enzyme